jgi:hypothetical protein
MGGEEREILGASCTVLHRHSTLKCSKWLDGGVFWLLFDSHDDLDDRQASKEAYIHSMGVGVSNGM